MDENTPITDKYGYNKLLKEIENEEKRIKDPLTNGEQKNVSNERLGKLNKLKDDYLAKGQPKKDTSAFEGAKENYLKNAAAYAPDMNSPKDASLKANPEILAADEARNEAKMADARNSANNAAVEETEAKVQDAVNNATEEAGAPELNETEPAAVQAQSDIEQAVAETKGSGTPTTPQTVLTNVADKYGFGLLKFDENGKIIVPDIKEESQWKRADTSGKLAMFGTALSCIVSALSGGNIPPINFNKIMGVDKQYTTYLANVHQFNEAVSSGVKKESENIADADYASYIANLPEKERQIVENVSSDYEMTKAAADKARLEKQGEVQKDLIEAQAKAGLNRLVALNDLYKRGLITEKTLDIAARATKADMGDFGGPYERYLLSTLSLILPHLGAKLNTPIGSVSVGK